MPPSHRDRATKGKNATPDETFCARFALLQAHKIKYIMVGPHDKYGSLAKLRRAGYT